MRGIYRLNNAANRIQAWGDWSTLEAEAILAGHIEAVKELRPPQHAGWRLIDKRIAALRKILNGEN